MLLLLLLEGVLLRGLQPRYRAHGLRPGGAGGRRSAAAAAAATSNAAAPGWSSLRGAPAAEHLGQQAPGLHFGNLQTLARAPAAVACSERMQASPFALSAQE